MPLSPKARQTFACFCLSLAAVVDRQKKGRVCLGRGQGEQCTGTCRRCGATGWHGTPRPHQPSPRFTASLKAVLLVHNTKREQLLVGPRILPLKCCARSALTFSGATFPFSLASPSQGLSPSSADSSPPLSESSSPADAFRPSKEPSPVPAGFAGLASAVVASQPGWQFCTSSCPSAAASVGKDRYHHAPGKREPPPLTHTRAKSLLAEMGGTNRTTRRKERRAPWPSGSTASPPHSSQL